MLILGINGSVHQHGNTADLLTFGLDEAAKLGAKTQLIFAQEALDELKQPYCNVCEPRCPGVCYEGKKLEGIYNLLRECDGIILGSPVYFGTVSTQLKSFWDMSRKLRNEHALLDTVGGAVSVGAARFGGQETTLRALHDMMLVQGMLIVGDGHVSMDPGHHGACAQRPAIKDDYAITRVQILARRLVDVAKATLTLRKK
ncbi:flavodoxin family protein [Candidatus Contubernalis alkaliaceticus]|uniref:flavodoxin family protein n=1 Tax=Candidatus Contubernalis alkaliaceticus TaxID=338645 RepID=UPI001F4C1A1A|nr:flavodoxin family protein [Candidatus Contubernalis alkalaceticus]UNC92987.1 flavodoxin family protein [Candidatus Contubernalis alkalaceticus]